MITLTQRAGDELQALLDQKRDEAGIGLRLAVKKGGCAGWQYEMRVASPEPGDWTDPNGLIPVIIAADSMDMLQGCEIDYSDDLSDSGFKIHNPHAVRSCGCGTSFDTVDAPSGDSESEAACAENR